MIKLMFLFFCSLFILSSCDTLMGPPTNEDLMGMRVISTSPRNGESVSSAMGGCDIIIFFSGNLKKDQYLENIYNSTEYLNGNSSLLIRDMADNSLLQPSSYNIEEGQFLRVYGSCSTGTYKVLLTTKIQNTNGYHLQEPYEFVYTRN